MRILSTGVNADNGEKEATVVFTNKEIVMLREAMYFYDEQQKGDVDDPNKMQIRGQLRQGLDLARDQMNPS